MEPVIELSNVWKTYEQGGMTAVRGVDLKVAPGEICLILGPSGSGKTSLLQMAGTMLSPTKGQVRLAGLPVEGLARRQLTDLRRDYIGFVFQFFNLLPGLTALENVEVVPRLQGAPDAHIRSVDVLEAVGLRDHMDFYPSQLSGGQQQRVAVARALVHSPKAIFADEPTGALDSANGLAIMLILCAMARSAGSAVMVVTHDLRMRQLADRTYRMEDGVLKEWDKEWEPSWAEMLGKQKAAP